MKYLIPKDRLETLREKISKISKKAEKYNSKFTFRVLEEKVIKKNDDVVSAVEIEIDGNVGLTGWEYVGKLVKSTGFNVFEKVQDIEIPKDFLDKPLRCDHCGKDIYRKYTFVVYNGTEFKQVGRSCLKDYTGIDLEYLGYLMSLERSIERFWGTLRPEKTIDTIGFLRVLSEVIRKNNGKYIREASEEFRFPTVQTALCCYYVLTNDVKSKNYSKSTKKMAMDLDLNSPETSKIVKDIVENTRDSNLRNVIDYRVFPVSFASCVCELVFKYYTDVLDSEVEGEFYGEESEKFELDVTDFRLERTFEKGFGFVSYTTYLYSFRYKDYLFKWFSSNEIESSGNVHIKGTIKKHQEYKKHRETIVTRCKVLDNV